MSSPVPSWATWRRVSPAQPPARLNISQQDLEKSVEKFQIKKVCKTSVRYGATVLLIGDSVYFFGLYATFWIYKPTTSNPFWYLWTVVLVLLFTRFIVLFQRARNLRWALSGTESNANKITKTEKIIGCLHFFLALLESSLLGVAAFVYFEQLIPAIILASLAIAANSVCIFCSHLYRTFALPPILEELSTSKPKLSDII